MNTKTYFLKQAETSKKNRENLKKSIKELREETKYLKAQLREAKAAKNEDKYHEVDEAISKNAFQIEQAQKRLRSEQVNVANYTAASKLEFVKLENGLLVEVSRLREMHKKFRRYRLNYEYVQHDNSLEVLYTNASVKGRMVLVGSLHSIPDHVEVPVLKRGEVLDA